MIERKRSVDALEKMYGIENLRAELLQHSCRAGRNGALRKSGHRRRLRQSLGRLVHVRNERGRSVAQPRKDRVFQLLVGVYLHRLGARARDLFLILAQIESGYRDWRRTGPVPAAPRAIFLQIAGRASGNQSQLFRPAESHVEWREMSQSDHMRIPTAAIADEIDSVAGVADYAAVVTDLEAQLLLHFHRLRQDDIHQIISAQTKLRPAQVFVVKKDQRR